MAKKAPKLIKLNKKIAQQALKNRRQLDDEYIQRINDLCRPNALRQRARGSSELDRPLL